MFEILFEVGIQILAEGAQFLAEIVIEGLKLGFSRTSDEEGADQPERPRRRWPGRVMAGTVVLTSVFVAIWWGRYVASTGQTAPPTTMWTLLLGCAVAAVLALAADLDREPLPEGAPLHSRLFFFDRTRWSRLAWLNLVAAIAVGAGFWG